MQGYKKGHDYGPSWGDVCYEMEEFTKAHSRLLIFEVARTPRNESSTVLYFRLVSFSGWDHGFRTGERGEGHVWPSNEWSTVPAMLFALLHRLDHRLTEERQLSEAQASF